MAQNYYARNTSNAFSTITRTVAALEDGQRESDPAYST
jgi:hypothetical protein